MKTTPKSAVVESGRVSLAPLAETPKKRLLAPATEAACPSGGAAEGERGATLLCRRMSTKETEAVRPSVSPRFFMLCERRASAASTFPSLPLALRARARRQ